MSAAIAEVGIANHPVVSRQQWVAERRKLLAREKELTRLRDQIGRERRALPWVRIEKAYVFDAPEGRRPLADLFEGRRQLLVQHFMLGPGWEQGCPSCSFMADHIDGMNVHLAHRDVTLAAAGRVAGSRARTRAARRVLLPDGRESWPARPLKPSSRGRREAFRRCCSRSSAPERRFASPGPFTRARCDSRKRAPPARTTMVSNSPSP